MNLCDRYLINTKDNINIEIPIIAMNTKPRF